VLVFALVLTLLTGFLFGLVPALAAARTDIASTLREGAGTATATKRRNRTLRLLAVAQIAVAFFLTNCAILLYTSYKAVLDIPFHFDTENVIAARIATSGERYDNDEKKTLFWEQVIERVEVLPGVERAAVTTKLPLEGGNNSSILVAGETYDPQVRRPLVERSYVSPGYFEAMGIPLLAGSVFEAEDGTAERRVIVVNQELADRYFPDADAVGQVIRQNEAEPEWTATIVGVVANVRQWGPLYGALPEWYTPYRLNPYGDSHLVVRSAKAPSSLLPGIQKEVLQIDKDLPLSQPRTMGQVIAEATEGRRFLFTLVGLFAVLSVILAMAGIFGTVSHNVAQRTREIGVRVAFGAHRWRILRLVLRQGLIMSGVGIGTGVLLVLVFYSGLRSLFYGISPLQPTLAGLAILLLFVVTLVATVLPAFRAVRVDPMQALRFE
jgi:predicted permease